MNFMAYSISSSPAEAGTKGFEYTSVPFMLALASLVFVQISVYLTLPLGVAAGIWILFRRSNIIWPTVLWLLPFVVMIAIGIAVGLDNRAAHRDILRDVFYISIFVSYLIVGLALHFGGLTFNQLIMAVVIALTFQYAQHAVQLVTGIGADFGSVAELRDELGQTATGSAVLVLPSLYTVPLGLRIIFLSVLLPNFLSFGRSNLITLIFLLAAKGLSWLKWVVALVACLGAFYFALQSTSNRLLDSFTEKLMFSVQEVGDKNFYGEGDIHRKWRAYERYIVSSTINSGDGYSQLLGLGFGATAQSQINKRQDSSGLERTYSIPTFHDSSLFIELKLGMLGLTIWILWWLAVAAMVIIALWKVCGSRSRWLLHSAALGVTCAVSASLYGFPLMRGVGPETLMLGFLVGAYFGRSKNNSVLSAPSDPISTTVGIRP